MQELWRVEGSATASAGACSEAPEAAGMGADRGATAAETASSPEGPPQEEFASSGGFRGGPGAQSAHWSVGAEGCEVAGRAPGPGVA
eukprot:15465472-Alexandrium_andersonii.AAC.1